METNALLKEMPLTCLITNFSGDGGFERIYLATGHKPDASATNQFRKREEHRELKSRWNSLQLLKTA
jgi:hypothetical protein